MIGKNSIRFIYCLMIATFLWLFTAMNKTHQYQLEVPIKYAFESGKINKQRLPNQLEMLLSANGWKLLRAIWIDQKIEIPVVDNASQSLFVSNENKQIFFQRFPEGIEIVKISPDTLFFNVDAIMTKKIPIQLTMQVNLKTGFDQIGSIKLKPDSIEITGPSNSISAIKFWESESIQRNQVDKKIQGTVALKQQIKNNINISAIAVKFEIPIVKYQDLSIRIPISNHEISNDSIYVLVRVGQQDMEKLIAEKIYATYVSKAENKLNIKVHLPDQIPCKLLQIQQ